MWGLNKKMCLIFRQLLEPKELLNIAIHKDLNSGDIWIYSNFLARLTFARQVITIGSQLSPLLVLADFQSVKM